jgi:hypothetical protein
MSSNTSFFMNAHERAFGTYDPRDERIHHEANAEVDDPAVVETQFFGFNVPESGVHSLNYVWLHPNLGVASGGAWAYQGITPSQLHSELFDMRDLMPMSAVGELDSYTLPNGYQVEVVEPLRRVRLGYHDPRRDNAFELEYTAIMPPAMLASGRHFEQAMRVRGSVTLLGEQHTVDGFSIRDRSWGETRPEDPRPSAPIHWFSATFDEDLAFCVTAVEGHSPDRPWDSIPAMPDEQIAGFNRGWVWNSGELTAVSAAALRTRWDRRTGYPATHTLDLVDAHERRWTLNGRITAASRWHTWSNMSVGLGLVNWESGGKSGWGDSQSVMWADATRLLR